MYYCTVLRMYPYSTYDTYIVGFIIFSELRREEVTNHNVNLGALYGMYGS